MILHIWKAGPFLSFLSLLKTVPLRNSKRFLEYVKSYPCFLYNNQDKHFRKEEVKQREIAKNCQKSFGFQERIFKRMSEDPDKHLEMEPFVKVFNVSKPWAIFPKSSVSDDWLIVTLYLGGNIWA